MTTLDLLSLKRCDQNGFQFYYKNVILFFYKTHYTKEHYFGKYCLRFEINGMYSSELNKDFLEDKL